MAKTHFYPEDGDVLDCRGGVNGSFDEYSMKAQTLLSGGQHLTASRLAPPCLLTPDPSPGSQDFHQRSMIFKI